MNSTSLVCLLELKIGLGFNFHSSRKWYIFCYICGKRYWNTYDERLDFLEFKYLTANEQSVFLPIDCDVDDKINFKEGENEHKKSISFQPIKYKEVSYFIKAIYIKKILFVVKM